MSKLPYQKLIGSLMYLSVLTRPDITYAVNYLGQFNNNYSDYHWQCAKRVLRYLKGTKDLKLTYSKDVKFNLEGFVDSDWGSDVSDRKSYTGYVFKCSGGAISWKSCKQKTVALSSTEAEYMAIIDACKEAIYLRNLINEIHGGFNCITVYNDNQGANKLCYNPVFHERSKHIDIRYHFIRDNIEKGIVKVDYLNTNEMIADVLTKSLGNVKHSTFVEGLGLRNF